MRLNAASIHAVSPRSSQSAQLSCCYHERLSFRARLILIPSNFNTARCWDGNVGMTKPLELLDAILRASPFAIVVIDAGGRVRHWTPSAEKILGWTAEEIVGHPVPPESQLLLNLESEAEVGLCRKDGVPIHVEIRTVFWPEQDGQGILAIFSETGRHTAAERKLLDAEQELKRLSAQEKQARVEARTERRFRELLEAAPDAIIEVDRDGRIMLLNLVTEKMFGYRREDLVGKPVELLVPDTVRAAHVRHREGYWNHPATRPMGSGLALACRDQSQPGRLRGWVAHHGGDPRYERAKAGRGSAPRHARKLHPGARAPQP